MLTAEQIQDNWTKLLQIIGRLEEPRASKLLEFYENNKQFFLLCPASTKDSYHSAFPGGYVYHILNVVNASVKLYKLWGELGANLESFTQDELLFSSINHDLGKVLFDGEPCYLENDSDWHVKNQGILYKFNTNIPFMTVPDRSLFLLQEAGISYTLNEMLSIKLHDGLYDDSNKAYLYTFQPETKLRTVLPYIIHQADMLASKVEFEQQWLKNFKKQ